MDLSKGNTHRKTQSRIIPVTAVVTLSIIAIGITVAILFQGNAQPNDTWYLGQGTKKDMFVTYQLQQFDTNNGSNIVS